jgi:hypothetical protein
MYRWAGAGGLQLPSNQEGACDREGRSNERQNHQDMPDVSQIPALRKKTKTVAVIACCKTLRRNDPSGAYPLVLVHKGQGAFPPA